MKFIAHEPLRQKLKEARIAGIPVVVYTRYCVFNESIILSESSRQGTVWIVQDDHDIFIKHEDIQEIR